MTTMASIAELQSAGVTFEVEETVAIAQQLIRLLRDEDARPVEQAYGPLSAANVFLNEDGSVTCLGYETAPAVFDVATFIEALLPASLSVPGGLRYVIARATHAVDVATFTSLEEFSQALAKYESGSREDVVRRLLRRSPSVPVTPQSPDRRNPRVSTTELRRALREADARLYLQPMAASLDAGPPRTPRDRTLPAAAAGVAIGALLILSGEFMHTRRSSSELAPPPLPSVTRETVPAATLPLPAEPVTMRQVSLESPVVQASSSRSSVKPAKRSRPSAAPAPAVEQQPVRRGVLDRLRLGWLRKAFKG